METTARKQRNAYVQISFLNKVETDLEGHAVSQDGHTLTIDWWPFFIKQQYSKIERLPILQILLWQPVHRDVWRQGYLILPEATVVTYGCEKGPNSGYFSIRSPNLPEFLRAFEKTKSLV